ncbi:protein NUCLEAR FUSION DEFECTIVE 6, mitochondrial [Mercurialis annua]|uniref:protein NUCLEAR FUSION DEFECTIVE 6, mitochondrial n=1 Tax=Mercurialis annua TaxID=3986 RepID=UPI00215E6D1E|nr:protein NUCLEAR FUSION DEFECTIVE 6, mitochondrial [Mercurialis annua]
MAANGARRTLQIHLSLKTLLSNSAPTKAAAFIKPSSSSRFSPHKLRLPLELGAAQSLLPMHSVTASALLTSLLSLHNHSWGCLSEGFATPL